MSEARTRASSSGEGASGSPRRASAYRQRASSGGRRSLGIPGSSFVSRTEPTNHRAPGAGKLALRGPGLDAEQIGNLRVGVALHIVKQEHFAVAGREGRYDPIEIEPVD